MFLKRVAYRSQITDFIVYLVLLQLQFLLKKKKKYNSVSTHGTYIPFSASIWVVEIGIRNVVYFVKNIL